MIIVQDERRFAAYFRTNRRTQWRHSTYAGRWETVDRAVAEVKDRLAGQRGEYLIEDGRTDEKHTGML